MSKIPHKAFTVQYKGIPSSLITEVELISAFEQTSHGSFRAIWDTGATHSVITEDVFNRLKLSPIDTTLVHGVNSEKEVPVTLVNIVLPNRLLIPNWRVTVCDITGCDMLIGMDIIRNGDFSISNGNNETLFSFAIPPFDNKIDLVEKANKTNQRNKKHFH